MNAPQTLTRRGSFDRDALRMSLDVSQIDAFADELEKQVQESLRPAAQAGAQIVYEKVVANVSNLGAVSGRLRQSIYQAWSKDRSGDWRQTYHVSWRTGQQKDANGKTMKTGLATAPHGHLVEFGFVQRYKVIWIESKGIFRTVARPESRGKPKPSRRASQAEKDAYWQPRPGGPLYVTPRPFVRSAVSSFQTATEAMREKFFAEIRAKGTVK